MVSYSGSVLVNLDDSTVGLNSGGTLLVKDDGITVAKLNFSTWERTHSTALTANGSAVSFTGLSGTADGTYMMIAHVVNNSGDAESYELYYNGDYTTTNYQTAVIYPLAVPGTVAQNRYNSADISGGATLANAKEGMYHLTINQKSPSKYPIAIINGCVTHDSPSLTNAVHVWQSGVNIATVTMKSGHANGMGSGSTFELFRISTT